ncbi:MAG: ATP-binding protein [Thermomicrobiales bacterium]
MAVSPPGDHRSRLPAPLTPLVGRERELEAIHDLLGHQSVPLLTLTGAGGTGKTRLALQVAGDLAADFAAAVYVPLAAIGDHDLVAGAIAQELGLRDAGDRPRQGRLADALRGEQVLLVLDNFEAVVGAAPVIADLLADCPDVKLLVTSRVPLRIAGEQEFPVPPLALPNPRQLQSLGDLAAVESVALFVQRARAVRPDFALTDANAETVTTICRRLDGLPLAIELAAARTKVLSPQALLARLTNRLHVLTGGARDQPARLQTMRDAIAWSYDLLDEEEQALFRRLAVFAGGCSLDAAERVVSHESRDVRNNERATHDPRLTTHDSVLDGLASLVDKSLLRPAEEVDGEPRFVMLETVREYGIEQLGMSGEEEATRRAHAAHYLWLAERAHPGRSGGVQEARWLEVLEAEHDNLRSALAWSTAGGEVDVAIRLAAALGWFWYLRGHLGEGRRWLDQALSLARPHRADAHLARALRAAGKLAWEQADYAHAADLLQEGAALARSLGDEGGAARALLNLGVVAERQGDDERAASLFDEALSLFRALDERPGIANALLALAETAFRQNDLTHSADLSDEALVLSREIGDPIVQGLSWQNLGQLALARGDLSEAGRCYKEGLRLFVRLRNTWGIADALGGIAGVALAGGEADRAARWLGAAQEFCAAIGAPTVPHQAQFDRSLGSAQEALQAAAFEEAARQGRAMTAEDVATEALNWSPRADRSPARGERTGETATFGLTEREREVLRLLASGMTNNEIADALWISPRTASTHVGHILEKLGVNSRAAAVAIAFLHGLA